MTNKLRHSNNIIIQSGHFFLAVFNCPEEPVFACDTFPRLQRGEHGSEFKTPEIHFRLRGKDAKPKIPHFHYRSNKAELRKKACVGFKIHH